MTDDDLDIPAFLKREKTNPIRDNNTTVPAVKHTAEQEKWRIMEQQRRDRRKTKTSARIAKMKAVKADRDAVAAGKTWNADKGQWE